MDVLIDVRSTLPQEPFKTHLFTNRQVYKMGYVKTIPRQLSICVSLMNPIPRIRLIATHLRYINPCWPPGCSSRCHSWWCWLPFSSDRKLRKSWGLSRAEHHSCPATIESIPSFRLFHPKKEKDFLLFWGSRICALHLLSIRIRVESRRIFRKKNNCFPKREKETKMCLEI